MESILDSRRYGRGRKLQYLVKWKGYSDAENQWVDAKDVHADQLLDQFRKRLARSINTEAVHCRRTITSMSSDGSSTHSPDLFELPLPAQNDVSEGKAEALAIVEAFKSWRPQIPSSWRTPSDSEDASSPNDYHSDDGSPIFRRCFSMPQQLIPTQGGYQSLHAGRTPGEPLRPLIPTDDKPDQLCAPQHCPLPDSPVSSQSSFPAPSPVVLPNAHVVYAHAFVAQTLQSLEQEFAQSRNQEHRQHTPSPDILPIWPRPEDDHPVGPLPADEGGAHQGPPVLHIDIPSDHEEAPSILDQSRSEEDVGRDGAPDDALSWKDADPPSSWDDYGLDRSPPGFVLNKGPNFINFQVPLPGGKTMQAHYIKIEWTDDPIVYGKLEDDPHTYFEYIHATPYYTDQPIRANTPTQLSLFDFNHPLCNNVDDAMAWIGDRTLQGEIVRRRRGKICIEHAEKELQEAQDNVWRLRLEYDSCAKRLSNTNTYFRLGTANKKRLSNLVTEYLAR